MRFNLSFACLSSILSDCDRHNVDTQSTLGKDKKWLGGREIEGGIKREGFGEKVENESIQNLEQKSNFQLF